MNTNFPEEIFDNTLKNTSIITYKSNIGKTIAASKKILFAGICRNVGKTLAPNIERIIRTSKEFQNFHIFLYENDSDDDTVDILQKYSKTTNLTFLSENRHDKDYRKDLDNGVDPWHVNRCRILADCRNIYLRHATIGFSDFDYLCVLDLDIKGGWSYTGFNHGIFTLESDEKYACVSSYGILSEPTNVSLIESIDPYSYIMYDSFAFRPITIPNSGIHMLRMPMFNGIKFSKGDDPIEVASNFGGMAIYKLPLLKNVHYGSKQWKEGEVDPDHVILHRQLRQKGYKIILDPNMIVSYSDHKFSKENKNDKSTVSY